MRNIDQLSFSDSFSFQETRREEMKEENLFSLSLSRARARLGPRGETNASALWNIQQTYISCKKRQEDRFTCIHLDLSIQLPSTIYLLISTYVCLSLVQHMRTSMHALFLLFSCLSRFPWSVYLSISLSVCLPLSLSLLFLSSSPSRLHILVWS